MDPITALALANGLITLLEKLAPEIQAAVHRGEISPEQQQALFARLSALRPGGTAFSGREWDKSK